jgi:hypothetical protein
MTYLFDKTRSGDIIARINKLTPVSTALWGKMNVSQMLAHCQAPLQVAIGEHELKRSIMGLLFGRLAKKKLVSDKPYSRSLPTAPSFVVKDERNFEEERSKLINIIEKFTAGGPDGLIRTPHPFFGPLTVEEWDKCQWKHLDHHLQQFGV